MQDPLSGYNDSLSSPARQAFTVIPSDTDALPLLPKCLCIGAAGTIALRAIDSENDVSVTVQAGQILPVRASHVRAAGTTATDIVALA